jgi:hypothetical protein
VTAASQVAADLRAAAEVLRRDGWTQRSYHSDNGCHCALGAIAIVTGYHDMKRGPRSGGDWPELGCMVGGRPGSAAEWLGEFLNGHPSASVVVDWNDKYGRTADEVIAALEAAADAAEREQS